MEVSTRLRIRVTPGSKRDGIAGWEGGVLRLRVTAPPLEGKANKAVIALLSRALKLPSGDVQLLRGQRSREKTLVITGLSEAEVRARLGAGGER
ncbi:MAG: DUF167 domain-containing protein [Dehalococcoidia bacterium]